MTALDNVRARAETAGKPEAICAHCSWFDAPKDGGDMGQCRQRRGEQQLRFGVCLNWTAGKTDLSRVKRDPNVVSGPRPIFPGVEKPVDRPLSAGDSPLLACAEDGCDGKLVFRWSTRLQKAFYGCTRWPECKGVLPANDDGTPRGEPRTRELMGWRNKAHEAFDLIWRDQHATRPAAYSWLRAATGLDHESAHMSKMGVDQCKLVLHVVETKGPGTEFWDKWKTEHAARRAQKKRARKRSRKGSSPRPSSTR